MSENKEDLCRLFAQKDALENQMLVRNKYARVACPTYRFAAPPTDEYMEVMGEASARMDQLLLEIMDRQDMDACTGPLRLKKENVFVWGGPTPNWGGSMEPDTSVKGAEYFQAENVVYVYGPLSEEAMELHKGCRRLVCQITSTARIEGAQQESDVESAERLSKLSLKYPNIIGGIADDLVIYLGRNYSVKDVKAVREALKKHNPALDMYGVVYARELDNPNIPFVAECLDVVNLWIDRKSQIVEFDYLVEKCRVRFPGKKIMLGIFMQDIGLSDLEYDCELIRRYLLRAEAAFKAGKINDIVILGDREIAKFPKLAETIKAFLTERFNFRA